jgi:hypothetical protein
MVQNDGWRFTAWRMEIHDSRLVSDPITFDLTRYDLPLNSLDSPSRTPYDDYALNHRFLTKTE